MSSLRLASLLSERAQALFHSAFVMCVSRSQYPIQSSRLLPPPPAVLGAASVGLALEEAGEDIESDLAVPPVARVVVVTAGDSGARDCNCGAGAPIADAGAGGGALGGTGSVETALMVEADTGVADAAAADAASGADNAWACRLAGWAAARTVEVLAC